MQQNPSDDTIEFNTGYRVGPEGVHLVERQMLFWQIKRIWDQGLVLAKKTKGRATERIKGVIQAMRLALTTLKKS